MNGGSIEGGDTYARKCLVAVAVGQQRRAYALVSFGIRCQSHPSDLNSHRIPSTEATKEK